MNSFDKLPHEVLCRIISYLVNPYFKRDLHQIQLTNKRCQSIAEAYLYETLRLTNPYQSFNRPLYFQFLMNPDRCKLVKTLQLKEDWIKVFNDSFFALFPNIQRISYIAESSRHYFDWKYFSKIFTADRCKLKEIPNLGQDLYSIADGCFGIIQNHHQTLERLNMYSLSDVDVYELIQYINNAQWILPKLKGLRGLDVEECPMQDLDDTINKCPLLEVLDITFAMQRDLAYFVPDRQHQHLMKSVSVKCTIHSFFEDCSYFLAKFPNVQKWCLTTTDTLDGPWDEEPSVSMDEMIDFLNSSVLMKSEAMITISFMVECSTLPRALDFFCESSKCKEVFIQYENCDRPLYDNIESSSVAIVAMTKGRGKIHNTQFWVSYLPSGLSHLEFIETVGERIQTLSLETPSVKAFNEMTPRALKMLAGGMVSHAICNCPALQSLKVNSSSLSYLAPIDKIQTSLETLEVDVNSITEELLENLSYYVPNVKHFQLEAIFNKTAEEEKEDQKRISINMPHNSFESLDVVDKARLGKKVTLSKYILIRIISPTRPVTDYYFKRHTVENKTRRLQKNWVFREQKFEGPPFPKCKEIVITCKSIKSFKYSVQNASFDGVIISKKIDDDNTQLV